MKPTPYGPFPYSPIIRRPRLTWPGDAHVALWVIPNIEFFSLMEKVPAGSGGPGTPVPDIPSWSARDYGNRVGVFRLMQVLDRHGIRATVALNSDVCVHHPEIIEEGRTGFLVNDVQAAARAVEQVAKISREECRQRFEERFSATKMAKNYLAVYKNLTRFAVQQIQSGVVSETLRLDDGVSVE